MVFEILASQMHQVDQNTTISLSLSPSLHPSKPNQPKQITALRINPALLPYQEKQNSFNTFFTPTIIRVTSQHVFFYKLLYILSLL